MTYEDRVFWGLVAAIGVVLLTFIAVGINRVADALENK